MKKLFNLLFVTSLVCFGTSIHGMECPHNEIIFQPTQENQIQEAPWLSPEIVARIAGFCWPKGKNLLMRLCKDFCMCLKDRKLIVRANPFAVGIMDKVEALIEYAHEGDVNMTKLLLKNGVSANWWNILG